MGWDISSRRMREKRRTADATSTKRRQREQRGSAEETKKKRRKMSNGKSF
jgi:hypothetical protein